jgi:hypothetical protein
VNLESTTQNAPSTTAPLDWAKPLFSTNGQKLTLIATTPDGGKVLQSTGKRTMTLFVNGAGINQAGKRVVFNGAPVRINGRLKNLKAGQLVFVLQRVGRKTPVERAIFLSVDPKTHKAVVRLDGANTTSNFVGSRVFSGVGDIRKYALELLQAADELAAH